MKGRRSAASRAAELARQNPRVFAEKSAREVLKHVHRLATPPKREIRRNIGGVMFHTGPEDGPTRWSLASGSYETEIAYRLRQLLAPGDVVLDVGANVGYIAAIAASIVGPRGEVHCFEPVPRLAARLHRLARDNPRYGFVVHECAIGDTPGVAEIRTLPFPSVGKNTLVPGLIPDSMARECIDVAVKRLDDLVSPELAALVRVVKVDVEGFELPALRSMSRLFDAGWRPTLLVEV
ncbi:MAG: FkbM family methyltransferase, partial [Bradymonadia bacterium]